MQIYIGADHAGLELKEKLVPWLKEKGHEVTDYGAYEMNPEDDYPDFVEPVARAVASDPEHSRGIVIGGSGQGEAIVANRINGVRAVVCYSLSPEVAKMERKHNNANILSLGARYIREEEAIEAVRIFLETEFDGGRHKRRLEKIDKL